MVATGMARLRPFATEETGQDLIEYTLLAGLISITAVTLLPPLRDGLQNFYNVILITMLNAAAQL